MKKVIVPNIILQIQKKKAFRSDLKVTEVESDVKKGLE